MFLLLTFVALGTTLIWSGLDIFTGDAGGGADERIRPASRLPRVPPGPDLEPGRAGIRENSLLPRGHALCDHDGTSCPRGCAQLARASLLPLQHLPERFAS